MLEIATSDLLPARQTDGNFATGFSISPKLMSLHTGGGDKDNVT